jgi:hypothetical protein
MRVIFPLKTFRRRDPDQIAARISIALGLVKKGRKRPAATFLAHVSFLYRVSPAMAAIP